MMVGELSDCLLLIEGRSKTVKIGSRTRKGREEENVESMKHINDSPKRRDPSRKRQAT